MARDRLSTSLLPETDAAWAVLAALLASAVFGNTLAGGFVRSDFQLLADNPLLRGWSALPALLLGRSWDGPLGTEVAPPAYRPLAMLSYLLTCQLAGPAPWVQHLVNTALYAADCVLLFLVGRRFCSRRTAFAAACLFAVLPVHCEVVAYASERAELLLLFFLLLAWRELGRRRPRPWPGFLYYGLALASREQALLFPILLALQDWVFLRRRFWHPPRRWVHLCAAGMSLAWLLLGGWIAGGAVAGGRDYFEGLSYLVRLLTMARFSLSHYAFPLVSGTGLQGDYTRPFFPDSPPADLASWAVLLAAAALLGWAARGVLRQRSRYGFWALFAFLLWLPESNLLGASAVLGSDRALFLPSIGYCFALAMAFSRVGMPWRAAAVLFLLAWYGGLSVVRNRVWADERGYQEDAARRNPHGKGLASLGASLLEQGKIREGVEVLEEAARLGPGLPEPSFHLGKVRWEAGDSARAESHFKRAAELSPSDPDTRVFLGLIAEKTGRPLEAQARYEEALALRPADAAAKYAYARLLIKLDRTRGAEPLLEEFLRFWPKDPAAPAARAALKGR